MTKIDQTADSRQQTADSRQQTADKSIPSQEINLIKQLSKRAQKKYLARLLKEYYSSKPVFANKQSL